VLSRSLRTSTRVFTPYAAEHHRYSNNEHTARRLWCIESAVGGGVFISVNLLFLVPRLDVGGVQRQLCLLSGGLHAAGHRVLVATLVPGGAFRAALFTQGIPAICLGDGERPSPRLLTRLLAVLDREQPDILHSYLPSANVLAALAKGLRPHLPVVWGLRVTEGDTRSYGALHRITYWLERNLPWTADLMIANAPSVRDAAIAAGLPASRIEVVPNGFDTDGFRLDQEGRKRMRLTWGIADSERLIGLVGRLDPMKGHEVFLEAARRLATKDPTLRFVCVGPDPYGRRPELEALTRRLGLANRLSWRRSESRMWEVYSALDILCHPSIFGEGFPNVIAEAMLCEVPCVATDVGHSGELVRDVGALVSPGDAEALAYALRALLRRAGHHSTAARRLGRERIAKAFPVEALVARTEAALSTLNEAAARRSAVKGRM
jgi:glycosyltransferase involved in cell wall biosynthesis